MTLALYIGQCTRSQNLSHRRAAKAHANMRICTDSPEPSLLPYTKKHIEDESSEQNLRPLAWLDTSAWWFTRIISTKILYAGKDSLV